MRGGLMDRRAASRPAVNTSPRGRAAGARDRLARLQVLYKISNILTTTQRSETVLRLILKETVKATRATSGSLILIDRAAGILNIEMTDNLDPETAGRLKLRVGEGVTGWVAKTGKPLLVGDVRRSPHYVRIKNEVMSELAAPLIIGGEVVGVLNVDSNRAGAFDEEDKELLVAIAAQSSKVMQAANLYEENRRKAERLSSLFSVARTVASQPILEDVLRRIADAVRTLMEARVCSIMLLDEKGGNFQIKAVSGEVSAAYISRKSIPVGDNVIGRVIERRQPLFVADVRREKLYRMKKVARESGLCSLLSIPMLFLEKPIGVLNLYSGGPVTFSPEDIELLTAFAGHSAVAIVNAQRYKRIIDSEELLRESEKFQLLGTLSAEIAHEIRNPLAIMSILVHTLQENRAIEGDSRVDLNVIETKLRHINKIVDQVLDFSRANQSNQAPVDVNQIVEDVHMLVGYKASAVGRQIRKRLDGSLPWVLGDPGQIEQALLNVTLNGLQSMQNRGKALHLSTRRTREDGAEWIVVRVRDEGVGIPEEKIQQIFQPYFSMSGRGTGLGLFITRRIIQQHGGLLKVRSRVGEGTTFEIHLPAAGPGGAIEATS